MDIVQKLYCFALTDYDHQLFHIKKPDVNNLQGGCVGNGHLEQGKIGRGGEVRRGQVYLCIQDGHDRIVWSTIRLGMTHLG